VPPQPELLGYSFKVYFTGETARSREAVTNLRALCEARVAGLYELEIVDVLERPDLAEDDRIVATPTVIRLAPPPRRRVIGDLSDSSLAASALDLPDTQAASRRKGDPR
jgi:circadian clock protein KaiB